MNNTSIYRIATIHMPIVFRAAAKFVGLVRVFVSYLQYVCLRHELYASDTTLQAYMTPQVCYLEKLLQMHISPQAAINPQAEGVILYREDEGTGTSHFIDDSSGQVFYTESEFGLAEFTVILPSSVLQLISYAKELLDHYKLPGTIYTIVLR